jgi:hypothetical protein
MSSRRSTWNEILIRFSLDASDRTRQRHSRKSATRREGALMADRMSFRDFDPCTITRTGS